MSRILPLQPRPAGWLRYRADRRALAAVAFSLALLALPFVLELSRAAHAALWIAIFVLRIVAMGLQHYHAHLPVFRSRRLNAVYGQALTLLTGLTTAEWELQHNRGHHRHYRSPERDVAGSVDPCTGATMSHAWYIAQGSARIFGDCARIARAEDEASGGGWIRKLALEYVLAASALALLCLWNLRAGLAYGVVQSLLMRTMIWWGSYWHHLDVPRTGVYDSSVTLLDPVYNFVLFNSGHHTAHHEKPTLHWSLLPQRTERIRALIPGRCIHGSAERAQSQPEPRLMAAAAAERIASS